MADDAADRLVARAIESVLDQVPGIPDTCGPEAESIKLQPWAETAAPVGRNKRPLEELLIELGERVAGTPGARASLPPARHPGLAFFDRFGRGRAGQSFTEAGGDAADGRRRRRRRGGAARGAAPVGTAAVPVAGEPDKPPGARRQQRRGRRGGGTGGEGGDAPPRVDARGGAPPGGAGQPGEVKQPAQPGASSRRRRGRRGRGSGTGTGQSPAG